MTELIYGKGLSATDASRKPEAYAQMMSLFKRTCLRKVTFDLKALGQAAFQIIYNKDKSKIVQVAHMPIETLRFEKMNEDGEVTGYYYSKDWTKIRKKGYEPERIPAFGHGAKGEALEIFLYQALPLWILLLLTCRLSRWCSLRRVGGRGSQLPHQQH